MTDRYGSAPATAGLKAKEQCEGKYRTTVLEFSDYVLPMADNAGVGAHGGAKVYDFDEGAFMFLGATADLQIATDSAGIVAAFDGDFGLGSTVADSGATLATTEQDLIPTTATPQAVAGATTAKGVSTATEAPKIKDGTATAVDVYLNILVDDTDQDITATPANLIVNGKVVLSYVLLGDK